MAGRSAQEEEVAHGDALDQARLSAPLSSLVDISGKWIKAVKFDQ